MTTPAELINLALKQSGVLGVGQTAAAEDVQDAFKLLNMMLAQWQTQRYLVYHLVTVSKVATGAISYTIGTGGDFNVARPDRISSAFVRRLVPGAPNQVDYQLTILKAREDYDRIALKSQPSVPQYLFYDSGYPLGRAFPWGLPDSQYELHVTLYEQLQKFATIADVINMPPAYEEPILWNLAGRLRPMYGLPPDNTITALARASLNILKGANAQIPALTLDPQLIRSGRYNVRSDIGA